MPTSLSTLLRYTLIIFPRPESVSHASSPTTTPHAALYGAYLAGIGTFIYGFWRWTDPALLFGPGSVTATAAKWAYLAAVRG